MTENKDLKRLVRERMSRTGESYTTALAQVQPRRTPGSAVEAFRKRMYTPPAPDRVRTHLEHRYGIEVSGITELDVGVFRISCATSRSWIARAFPPARPLAAVEGDAAVLRLLEMHGFPAERCADDEPVSTMGRRGVLVTECITGLDARFDATGDTLYRLGDLLGRLHSLPVDDPAASRQAGSWHHLSPAGGGREHDVTTLLTLFEDVAPLLATDERAALEVVRTELAAVETGSGLPACLIHPQPSGADAIAAHDGRLVLVDWAGAGVGPRVLSLASLLSGSLQAHPQVAMSRDLRRIDAVIAGYRAHVRPGEEELARLPQAMASLGLIIDCWSFLFQDLPIARVAAGIGPRSHRSAEAAQRVRAALDADHGALVSWFTNQPPPVDEAQGRLL